MNSWSVFWKHTQVTENYKSWDTYPVLTPAACQSSQWQNWHQCVHACVQLYHGEICVWTSGEWYIHTVQNWGDGMEVVWTSERLGSQTGTVAASCVSPTSFCLSPPSSPLSFAFSANLLDTLSDLWSCHANTQASKLDTWSLESAHTE